MTVHNQLLTIYSLLKTVNTSQEKHISNLISYIEQDPQYISNLSSLYSRFNNKRIIKNTIFTSTITICGLECYFKKKK